MSLMTGLTEELYEWRARAETAEARAAELEAAGRALLRKLEEHTPVHLRKKQEQRLRALVTPSVSNAKDSASLGADVKQHKEVNHEAPGESPTWRRGGSPALPGAALNENATKGTADGNGPGQPIALSSARSGDPVGIPGSVPRPSEASPDPDEQWARKAIVIYNQRPYPGDVQGIAQLFREYAKTTHPTEARPARHAYSTVDSPCGACGSMQTHPCPYISIDEAPRPGQATLDPLGTGRQLVERVPWCEEHATTRPGLFAHCLACAVRDLTSALSFIDSEVTGEHEVSPFDVDCDEKRVVERVKAYVAKCQRPDYARNDVRILAEFVNFRATTGRHIQSVPDAVYAAARRVLGGDTQRPETAGKSCARPPEGWSCSREAEHDGPWASWPRTT